MKKQYTIKETVYIHMGERRLVEGRVVEIIDLSHLDEGHSSTDELYIIEIKTGIDNVYEVRNWDQISPSPDGPINLFRNLKNVKENSRYFKKVGMPLPVSNFDEDDEPTPEQIQEALERSQQANKHPALNLPKETKPRRHYYKKKK